MHNSTPKANAGLAQPRLLKTALHIPAPNTNAGDARTAATRLEPHLPTPSVLEKLHSGKSELPRATLFGPSSTPPIIENPSALFEQNPPVDLLDVPQDWLPVYEQWCQCQARRREFDQRIEICQRVLQRGGSIVGCIPRDAVVAGLFLFLLNPTPESALRNQLQTTALEDPFASYMAAEGLTVRDEHPLLVKSISPNHRLLYWASQIPGFAAMSVVFARKHYDLWCGLILARYAETPALKEWLSALMVAAGKEPAAASAALILQPNTAPEWRQLWINTLQQSGAAMRAYETLRWNQHTGLKAEWVTLEHILGPSIRAERGTGWFHFLRDIRPDLAQREVDESARDPLWMAQLLSALNLSSNRWHYRLGEQLGCRPDERETQILLRYLDYHKEGSAHGATIV